MQDLVGNRVSNNRIKLVALLGEGSYGCVYRGIITQPDGSETLCAVKCLSKANLDAYHLMCQRREILLHKQVSDGPGIVTLLESFEDSDYQWIVMEDCTDGDLWEAIAAGQFVEKNNRIRDIFSQVLKAVEYCHSKHVFHRDIKPENVLLTDGGRKALLADFGLASGSPMSSELRCGSPWYMSPECWGGIYDTNFPYPTAPNDIWCLGILLVNMSCGRHAPWRNATRHDALFREFMKEPRLLRRYLPLSPQLFDLLERVFTLTPATRICIQDFRVAVSRIKYFAIPAEKLAAFHDKQRADWSTAIGPSASRHLSMEVILSSLSSVDITEGVVDQGRRPIRKTYISRIPMVNTRRKQRQCSEQGTALSSSGSGGWNSLGPITPQMMPTVTDVEVVDIPTEDAVLPRPVSPLQKAADASVLAMTLPFQNILRALGAL